MKKISNRVSLVLIICTWFVLFIGHSSLSQEMDLLDSAILKCLQDKSRTSESDIIGELNKFEKYLISQGTLLDSTGESYLNVYQTIVRKGDFTHYNDYNKKTTLDSMSRGEFGTCYYQFNGTLLFENSNSKYKELTHKMELLGVKGNMAYPDEPLRSIGQVYVDVLTAKDFENPIFKYSTLYFLYNTAFDLRYKY